FFGWWGKWCLWTRLRLLGSQHSRLGRYVSHIENLAPAETEPAIAYHQAMLARRKLPGHRLHAVGSTTRHDNRRLRVIHLLEGAANVFHYTLKACRHMV